MLMQFSKDSRDDGCARSNRPARRTGRAMASVLVAGSVLVLSGAPAFAEPGVFLTESAGATFERSRGTVVDVGIEQTDDEGQLSETLEVSVTQSYCRRSVLVEVDLSGSIGAEDLDGVIDGRPIREDVSIRSRAGKAATRTRVPVTGTVTRTPSADSECSDLDEGATSTEEVAKVAVVHLRWENAKNSVPVVFSGEDCGGDGTCYFRDAEVVGSVVVRDVGSAGTIVAAGSSGNAFFFEGTYIVSEEEPVL